MGPQRKNKFAFPNLFKPTMKRRLISIRRIGGERVGGFLLTKYICIRRLTFFHFLAYDIFVYVRTLFLLCFLFLFWTMWSLFVHDPLFNLVDNNLPFSI